MAWKVEFTPRANRNISRLDKQVTQQIKDTLEEVAELEDPTTRGKPLKGNLRGLWRYRVGGYRIICSLEPDKLLIIALDVGHRSKIYKL